MPRWFLQPFYTAGAPARYVFQLQPIATFRIRVPSGGQVLRFYLEIYAFTGEKSGLILCLRISDCRNCWMR